VQLVGDVIFLATQARKGEHTSYAVLAAIEDARAALDAFLKNEQPAAGAAGFPNRNQLTDLCPIRSGGRSVEPLNDWLAQYFPGFRQLRLPDLPAASGGVGLSTKRPVPFPHALDTAAAPPRA
jgi:hypothetical protein